MIRPDGTRLNYTYEGYGKDQTFKSITYQILDTAEVCMIVVVRPLGGRVGVRCAFDFHAILGSHLVFRR